MADRRLALITGGARGIGRALAIDLAADWDIALCYRTSEADAKETAQAIEERGGRALAVRCDVSDSEAVAGLFEDVSKQFGRLDAVVNCAGPYLRGKLLEQTPEDWRSMFANNLDPVFYTARLAAPLLIENGWGRIISFSMANSDRVAANLTVTAHFIAKAGVQMLTSALAKELARHKITVNSISPGFINSKSAPAEELESMQKRIPAGYVGELEDTTAAARYLLSDDARYVTGSNLIVSGGWGL